MSDDFERAVLFAFDYSGAVSPEIQAQAARLLETAASSPDAWQFCISRAESSAYDQVKFWCLQTLHAFISGPSYFQATDVQSRSHLKSSLVSLGTNGTRANLPPFIRNKIAQAVVAIAAQEYPDLGWPTFFQDVLNTCSTQGPQAVDFLCRILVSIDEDIVSLEVPRSGGEAKRSTEFKDAMRATALQELATAWTRLVRSYKDTAPDLTAAILAAVQRYVHWVDISLVANDEFISLLYSILDNPKTHSGSTMNAEIAAAGVLIEVVSKRMEPLPKLSLIQSLGLTPVCASWGTVGKFPGLDGDDDGGDGDQSLAIQFSKLLASLATEILESLKKVENSVLSMRAVGLEVGEDAVREAEAACLAASSLLDTLFPAILKAVKAGDDEITVSIAPFLLSYVARVRLARKRDPGYQPGHVLGNILDAVATGTRFPDDSAVVPGQEGFCELTAAEEEASMADRRQELFTIFRNAAKLASDVAVATVAHRMRPALSTPDAPWQDVELAMSLLFQLGEGGITPTSTALAIDAMMGAHRISAASTHHLVALALLETCTRYAKAMTTEAKSSNSPEMVVRAVGLFLGPIGLGHRSYDVVQPRAAYLLCRTIKTLRSFLQPFTGDLLQSLHPHLIAAASQRFYVQGALPASVAGATAQKNALGTGMALVEDRLYVFEAAGLLIGAEEVPVDTQVGWLHTVTQPLVTGLSGNDLILFQQCLDALNKTCKGFSPRLLSIRPQLAAQLVGPLDQAVEALRTDVGHEVGEAHKTLRAKFLAYLHRLIETVPMPCISNRLSAVLWVLHSTVRDAADLADVLLLLNQVMVSSKEKGPELVNVLRQGSIAECMVRVWEMLDTKNVGGDVVGGAGDVRNGRQPLHSTAAGSREDVREKGELQRSYFAFLHSVVQADLGDIILARPRALEDLARGGVSVNDLSVRKLCIATLGKLAVSREHPSFFMHRFGVEVLLGGLFGLNATGNGIVDVRDAAAISLLTEVATQMQSLYKNCFQDGDEYLRCISANQMIASWPQDVKERLENLIKAGEPKQLKDFFKQVISEVTQSLKSGGYLKSR